MAKFTVKIKSILGGIAPSLYQGREDQFHASIGIDPDQPLVASNIKTPGILVPSSYSDISDTDFDVATAGYPKWILTNPKDANIYIYCSQGRVLTNAGLDTTWDMLDTVPSATGNGAAYYNNYLYFAGDTNISRYGPLDSSATFVDSVWTDTTFNQAVSLGNATYPTGQNVLLPNHPMHVHVDDQLYIGDFYTSSDTAVSTYNLRGKGLIHTIKTKRATTGANEGELNDVTTFNALDLPFGYAPTDIESWGNDIVVAAIPMTATGATSTLLVQGRAKLFFWDTSSNSFYRVIELVDPIVSALYNQNGVLYVWSGNLNNGVRVSIYEGGFALKQVAFFEEGVAPSAGAIDGVGNKVAWGAFTSYPEASASVYSLGYKDANLPMSLHNIINSRSAGTTPMVSALKNVTQASFIAPRFLVGWVDSSNRGVDSIGSTANIAVWRSLLYNISKPFRILSAFIPLTEAIAANHNLRPRIIVDDNSASYDSVLTPINNTNYIGSQRRVKANFSNAIGLNNFSLELRWAGSAVMPVGLPIVIEGEERYDATI